MVSTGILNVLKPALSNVHENKLILWSLLQITTTHTLAIREYYTIEIMLSEI